MFGRPTSTAWTTSTGSPRECHLPQDGGHALLGLGEPPVQFLARDERQVLVGEIEARFDVGQQIEQVVAQAVQRAGQSAGQLAQRDVAAPSHRRRRSLPARPRPGQVDPSGQKRPQGELARPGQSGAGGTERSQHQLQQRRRADGVNLGHRLAGVASMWPASRPRRAAASEARSAATSRATTVRNRRARVAVAYSHPGHWSVGCAADASGTRIRCRKEPGDAVPRARREASLTGLKDMGRLLGPLMRMTAYRRARAAGPRRVPMASKSRLPSGSVLVFAVGEEDDVRSNHCRVGRQMRATRPCRTSGGRNPGNGPTGYRDRSRRGSSVSLRRCRSTSNVKRDKRTAVVRARTHPGLRLNGCMNSAHRLRTRRHRLPPSAFSTGQPSLSSSIGSHANYNRLLQL